MTEEEKIASDFDAAWKEALDRFLAFFLAFFFREPHEDIDWTQDYDSLEQELREVTARGESGTRLCDKLVKVRVRDSDDHAYLHLEVQNRQEADFERRVYVYNYRAEDRFAQSVVSLVVYGDDNPTWGPKKYVLERWGCRKTFHFPVVKILKYRGREKKLEKDANPVALLVLSHLKAIETRQAMGVRLDWKQRVTKNLSSREMDAEDMRHWFRCIDWILKLPEQQEREFQQEMRRFEEERQMARLSTWEMWAQEKGREEGQEEGLRRGIEGMLELKFGVADPIFLLALRDQNAPILTQIMQAMKTATTLDDLRRLLPAKEEAK